jgi:ankyrin repeat protein
MLNAYLPPLLSLPFRPSSPVSSAFSLVHHFLESSPETLNARDTQGNTPLMHACQWGQYYVCLLLLDRNVHVNAVDFHRRNALYWTLVTPGASVKIVVTVGPRD